MNELKNLLLLKKKKVFFISKTNLIELDSDQTDEYNCQI